ncbi:hypothetical protein [Rubeoparvulum massiliense]|uniref:hypothetical protein n=1 Tax=Rubeoparvulum massiliense TaxID=1631346 RepID=UPI00065DC781|nr:hypothetical protein [Rubeoparvulum massiliense]
MIQPTDLENRFQRISQVIHQQEDALTQIEHEVLVAFTCNEIDMIYQLQIEYSWRKEFLHCLQQFLRDWGQQQFNRSFSFPFGDEHDYRDAP